nr:uncharacterized protein LOC124814270 [Hydra vulgaris]
MNSLRAECERLKLVSRNQNKCATFTIEMLKKNPEKCVMLTGLKYEIMLLMMDYLCEDLINYFSKLALKDQILMTLIKLKHNISFNMLAFISSISKTTMISYFWKWIDIMYVKLKFLIKMQDQNDIYKTIPPVFKAKFPRLTCIIDCFKIFIESLRCLLARAKCYSQYKKHCTIKVMTSCTPLGAVNFSSQCWGGRASDNQIVRESNFHLTKYHMPGDQILADRGFTLADDFAAGSGAELFVPAFTKGKDQLSSGDVEKTRKIASVRIHIERVTGLIKNRYTTLKGILPFRIVKNIKDETMNETLSRCDKIISVCTSLINLDTSIVTST